MVSFFIFVNFLLILIFILLYSNHSSKKSKRKKSPKRNWEKGVTAHPDKKCRSIAITHKAINSNSPWLQAWPPPLWLCATPPGCSRIGPHIQMILRLVDCLQKQIIWDQKSGHRTTSVVIIPQNFVAHRATRGYHATRGLLRHISRL